jgi:hypothetical protein
VVEKNKFVRMLQTFRPSQTVFETGIGTGSLGTKINGGAHPQQMTLKNKLVKGAEMMKALRQSTHSSLERNRVAVAQQLATAREQGLSRSNNQDDERDDEEEESSNVEDSDGDNSDDQSGAPSDEDDDDDSYEGDEVDEYDVDADDSFVTARTGPTTGALSRRQGLADALQQPINRGAAPSKVRLSITEKKKLKKKGLSQEEIRAVAQRKAAAEQAMEESGMEVTEEGSVGHKRAAKSTAAAGLAGSMSAGLSDAFRDKKHYMAYGDEDANQSFAEESMQPQSHLRTSESMSKCLY